MAINFSDSKFDSVVKIKNAEEDGKAVFTEEEKNIFIDVRVDGPDKGRKVAELLVKVKEASKKNVKDERLMEKLEEEAAKNNGQGSLAWQVINSSNYKAQSALNRLHKLLGSGKDDLPATKEERKTKRDEIKVEQNKKKSKLAKNKDRQITYRNQLTNLQVQKRVAQKNLARRNNFITIIRGDDNGEIIKADGSKVKLASFTGNKTIKDYSLGNVSKKDTDITGVGAGDVKTGDLKTLIAHANSFLDNLPNHKATHEVKKLEYIESKSLTTDFNGKRWASKNTLADDYESFGFHYFRILSDIGEDNLIKAVKKANLSSAEEKKMKGYVKDLVKEYDIERLISGKPVPESTIPEWNAAVDKWSATVLDIPYDQYPYVPMPEWEKLFEFMKKVFPPKTIINSSGDKIVVGLEDRVYLDDPNDDSFLKPSDGKVGWEGLTLEGSPIDLPSSATEFTLAKYIQNNKNKPGFDARLTQHGGAQEVPSSWGFKSLTGLWWKSHYHHMNDPDSLTDNGWKSNDVTREDRENGKILDKIRYARTMKAILKEYGISNEEKEFDYLLLEVAGEAAKEALTKPQRDSVSKNVQAVFVHKGKVIVNDWWKQIADRKIFTDDYDWKNFADKLMSMADLSESEVLRIDSEIEQVQKQISGLSADNATLQLEIDALQEDYNLLLDLDGDEEAPVDKNRTDFQTEYDKRGSQDNKWTRNQLRRMQHLLNVIKTKMNDDAAFEAEFKTKKDDVDGVKGKLDIEDGKLETAWDSIRKDLDGSVTETIKKIIKEKDTIGTSLEEAEAIFVEIDKIIKISDKEKAVWDEIKKAISNPNDFQDAPSTTLDEAGLTALLGIKVDSNLKNKWIKADEATMTESKINTIILNDYAPTKTKHDKLMAHLKDQGDTENDKTYTADKAGWDKFLGKGAKTVIRTIVIHEDETKKELEKPKDKDNPIVKRMLNHSSYNKDHTKCKFKKDRYGNPEEPDKVTKEQLINWLFDEKVTNIQQSSTAWETSTGDGNGTSPEKGGILDHLSKHWYWYAGGLVLIIILVAVVFWGKISEWWNGPAEEEGAGAEEGEEKDEEVEK